MLFAYQNLAFRALIWDVRYLKHKFLAVYPVVFSCEIFWCFVKPPNKGRKKFSLLVNEVSGLSCRRQDTIPKRVP